MNVNESATVSRILLFSCVDGPGNRLVIFLQGCNFSCISCHNPSTINHCNHCGECVATCPSNALSLTQNELTANKQTVQWDESLCTQCDQCISRCRFQSSPKTKQYLVDDLINVIRENHLFLSGITVTGGESTLEVKFIIRLFQAIKSDVELSHLTCFVDSNGSLSINGWQAIMPVMDGAMIDLKSWKNENHVRLTNRSNHRVFQTIELLSKHHKLYEVRLLHIPGQSDFDVHTSELSQYLKTLTPLPRIKLNAYSNHAVVGQALNWPTCTQEDMQNLVTRFEQQGIEGLIIPSVFL